jgi:glycosyltransferase involved in cell wall biosynthesis
MFVSGLLAGLRKRGHDVRIVSPLNIRKFWRNQLGVAPLLRETGRVRWEMNRFAPDAWLVYNTSVKNPDIFGWWLQPKRYVLLNTDAGTGDELPVLWRRPLAAAHRRSLARANWITAERPKNADHLRAFGVEHSRLTVMPPAVRVPELLPSRLESRRRLNMPPEAPIMLCVSRLTGPRADGKPWKTEWILTLLDALRAARLPTDALFILVGDGPGRAQVEQRIVALNLNGRLRLAGSVPHDEVVQYYAACDFVAYTPQTDRMFNTILEAQACGRPVVTLDSRCNQLIVSAGRTGLLAKHVEEFQVQLAELANDRTRCEAMGQAARDYVARFHSMDVRVREIESLLRGNG